MLVATLVLAAAAAHPLENVRLTPDQMFHLQVPYRYKVSIAEISRNALGHWELVVREFFCNDFVRFAVVSEPAPPNPSSPIPRFAMRGLLVIVLDDVLTFPDDRYHHLDRYHEELVGEYFLVVYDRHEKRSVIPPEDTPDP